MFYLNSSSLYLQFSVAPSIGLRPILLLQINILWKFLEFPVPWASIFIIPLAPVRIKNASNVFGSDRSSGCHSVCTALVCIVKRSSRYTTELFREYLYICECTLVYCVLRFSHNPIVLQCPSPKVRKKYKNHCTLAKIVKTASMTVIFEN